MVKRQAGSIPAYIKRRSRTENPIEYGDVKIPLLKRYMFQLWWGVLILSTLQKLCKRTGRPGNYSRLSRGIRDAILGSILETLLRRRNPG